MKARATKFWMSMQRTLALGGFEVEIEFSVDNGGSNGGGSFEVEDGSDAAEVTNVHKAGAPEVPYLVRNVRIMSQTKIASRAFEVKVEGEKLLDRYIEVPAFLLIVQSLT